MSFESLAALVCSNLKYLRYRSGLSYSRLAALSKRRKCYLPIQTVLSAEKGYFKPDLNTIYKASKFYGVPITDIISVDLRYRDEQAAIKQAEQDKRKSELARKIEFINPL